MSIVWTGEWRLVEAPGQMRTGLSRNIPRKTLLSHRQCHFLLAVHTHAGNDSQVFGIVTLGL